MNPIKSSQEPDSSTGHHNCCLVSQVRNLILPLVITIVEASQVVDLDFPTGSPLKFEEILDVPGCSSHDVSGGLPCQLKSSPSVSHFLHEDHVFPVRFSHGMMKIIHIEPPKPIRKSHG
jgi:hypothetical protein